jgi:CcmD family protein
MRPLSRVVVLALALAGGALLGTKARAQQDDAPADQDPAASRSATFQAVEGPTGEEVPGAPLLVGAYGAVLVLLLGYVLWLGRIQAGTARELERLRRALERAPDAGSAKDSAIQGTTDGPSER